MMMSGGRFSVGSCRSFAQIRISQGNTLYPVEIRKHADPGKSDVVKFDILDGISGVIRGQGYVVYRASGNRGVETSKDKAAKRKTCSDSAYNTDHTKKPRACVVAR